MKKILMLTGAIIALCGVTSCSDDNVASIDPVSTQAEENTPISFGTYVGNKKSTRAGYAGLINKSTLAKNGFGLFAYNTGVNSFGTEASSTSNIYYPNYMFNQHVTATVDDNGNYFWGYSPAVYWPNPTTDQTTLETKPQYLTFLAYGPYVEPTTANGFDLTQPHGADPDNDWGIVGFGYIGKNKGDQFKDIASTPLSDPYLLYSLNPNPSDDNGKSVDLVWGTAGSNSAPAAVTGYTGSLSNAGVVYTPGIYAVNSNLTKMPVGGKVQFKFIHALSAIGGNDNDGVQNSSGKGILIDYYADSHYTSGNQDKKDDATAGQINGKTKVLVNWIAVEFMTNNQSGDADKPYLELQKEGYFDLLTGKWTFLYQNNDARLNKYTAKTRPRQIYYFSPNGGAPGDGYQKYIDQYKKDGTLNEDIKVYNRKLSGDLYLPGPTINDYSLWISQTDNTGWETGAKSGVGNVAQAVFADQMAPIFFIPGSQVSANVVINYDIVTADPNITNNGEGDGKADKKYTVTHQEMSREVAFTKLNDVGMVMGFQYALYIHLGLTSMKVEATVTHFGTDIDDTETSTEPSADGQTDVYIPKNEQ